MKKSHDDESRNQKKIRIVIVKKVKPTMVKNTLFRCYVGTIFTLQ